MNRARYELGAVVLTGAVFLVFENILDAKLPFIAAAAVGWLAYLATRWREPGQVRAWGFRTDTLRSALRINSVLVLVAAAGILGLGLALGRGFPSAGFYCLILVYPVWGLVQQFLLCPLLCGNLVRATGRPALAVAVSAALFGIAHAPDWPLVGLTAVAGVAWTWIWLRAPNLWVQGIAHGLLGALAYYEVLGRDPWAELFGGG